MDLAAWGELTDVLTPVRLSLAAIRYSDSFVIVLRVEKADTCKVKLAMECGGCCRNDIQKGFHSRTWRNGH